MGSGKMSDKICVIGMWHLGCVTAACFAKLGVDVVCFDPDKKVIENLKMGKPPIYEPELEDLIKESASKGKLDFTDDLHAAVKNSEFIYIAFDTPVDKNDNIDLSPITDVVEKIIPLLEGKQTVIISSQIPVGTSDKILEKLRKAGKNNPVCYTPENLRLGNAIKCFLEPERIVFGISSESAKDRIENLFSAIPGEKIFMSLKSAEMTKHALNAYLASMISFSGEISNLCEETGANAVDVMNALKAEKRVSSYSPILPGLGFAGGTLARDVQILRSLGKEKKIKTEFLDAVISFNEKRMNYVPGKLKSVLGSLDGKKIAFLGLVYKAGTSTLRRSLALQVIDQLHSKNLKISAYDPQVNSTIDGNEEIYVCSSAYEAAKDADAVVITTDWPEFQELDFKKLASVMKEAILLDTKNMLEGKKLKKAGFRYYGIGVSDEK